MDIHYNDSESRLHMANLTDERVCFFHRNSPTADIYFLYNHNSREFDGWVSMRSSFNDAEMWNPHDGTRFPVEIGSDQTIQLHLEPYESTFIVLQ